jgi:hypothetical protein
MNDKNLNSQDLNKRVNETKLPSILTTLPTVCVTHLRHATYTAQANQCNFSPFNYTF